MHFLNKLQTSLSSSKHGKIMTSSQTYQVPGGGFGATLTVGGDSPPKNLTNPDGSKMEYFSHVIMSSPAPEIDENDTKRQAIQKQHGQGCQ